MGRQSNEGSQAQKRFALSSGRRPAVQTGAQAFTWLAVCTFALLLLAWVVALANTLRGVWMGALLRPPVAATSPA